MARADRPLLSTVLHNKAPTRISSGSGLTWMAGSHANACGARRRAMTRKKKLQQKTVMARLVRAIHESALQTKPDSGEDLRVATLGGIV